MSGKNPYARPDARTRSAKAAGYPARSVHKLEEIDRRFRILAPDRRVLDLGAAPGSWSLYASRRVRATGRVVAVDLSEITEILPANVTVLRGDALELGTKRLGEGGPYHVVLSDMAPNTSGDKSSDRALSVRLFTGALNVAQQVLTPGGSFVGKIFMSEDFEDARRAVRERFDRVETVRPRGTRPSSTEVFLVGMGLRRS